jgi:hypothetical protein
VTSSPFAKALSDDLRLGRCVAGADAVHFYKALDFSETLGLGPDAEGDRGPVAGPFFFTRGPDPFFSSEGARGGHRCREIAVPCGSIRVGRAAE